ncbi:MAG TPA: hypothetical protein VJN43_11970 [Bryobacteraceae bacterium]|nr:hypothetical protein [Bryobacteraceae bacterium]
MFSQRRVRAGWKNRAALGLLAGLAAGLWAQNHDRSIFNEIDGDLRQLSEISGLKVHHKIPYDLISKDQVNQFLKDRVEEVTTPEDLRIEGLALKKFGFVPQDFDLAKTTVDLLTEQAAAFYDYHKKKLYITDWAPGEMREAALVHELAHALADQNFHLERFIKQGRDNDDLAMARMAVMEGQATWLMSEVTARQAGRSLKDSQAAVELMSRAMESGGNEYPVYEAAPLYLRKTLIFPYTQGMLFQNAVVLKLGEEAFGQVFRKPPLSTQQILHPEKYFAGVQPARPQLPHFSGGKGYKRLAEGTMGELDHELLVEQFADAKRAEKIAPHWRGGIYALDENKSEGRVVLLYASEWDNPSAARQFFEVYQEALRKKWRKIEVTTLEERAFAGRGDDGYFQVRLEGEKVTSIEGLKTPAVN